MPSNVRPSTVSAPYCTLRSSWPRLNGSVSVCADGHVAVDVVVVVRVIDAVGRLVDASGSRPAATAPAGGSRSATSQIFRLRTTNGCCASGPTRLTPSPRLTPYRPSLRVDLVVLEADERQRADVDRLPACRRAAGPAESSLSALDRRRLEAEAVLAVLAGDVAGEGVEAVGPPEAGAVVRVERQHLLGQRLAVAAPARPGCGRGRCRPRCRLPGRSRGRCSGSRRSRGRRGSWCRGW